MCVFEGIDAGSAVVLALARRALNGELPTKESAMSNLKEIISQFAEQWAIIKAAPYPFVVALAVAIGVVWFILNYIYGAVVSSKNAQLELTDRQLTDYKQKLSVTSSDEAKAKLEALERRILQLEPRRITPQQRQILVESARPPDKTYRLVISHESGCPDCPQYAASVA